MKNRALFFGDNLQVIEEIFPEKIFDLIYLDPPFNSNRNYNVLFKEGLVDSSAQIRAFEDTWEWTPSTIRLFEGLKENSNPQIAILMNSLYEILRDTPMMAYLVNMTARLIPLRRVLKDTGSIYLHCDPTASHYLKIMMDAIFDIVNFRSEIIWKRSGSHNSANRFGPIHDVILFYSRSSHFLFNQTYRPYLKGHVEDYFKKHDLKGNYWTNALTGSGTRKGLSGKPWQSYNPTNVGRHWAIPGKITENLGLGEELTPQEKLDVLDAKGFIDHPQKDSLAMPTYRQYLETSPGVPIQDIWAYQPHTRGTLYGNKEGIDEDVRWLVSQGDKERLGYPTQKPQGLLERIIKASSNEGDWVLDPFCGCGTTIAVAESLHRNWIGIDVSMQSINVIRDRMASHFPNVKIIIDGIPKDFEGAQALADKDKFAFQDWAITLVGANPPRGESKKGADRGIDGLILFRDKADYANPKLRKILVQVKGGGVNRGDIAKLKGDIEREDAPMGILITLRESTSEMKREASLAGEYKYTEATSFPRIQILSIKDWFEDKRVLIPSDKVSPFKKAEPKSDQLPLLK